MKRALVVDGIIYQLQPKGGIARIYSEILPRMCDLEPTLNVTLLTESGRQHQELPTHARIVHRTIPIMERHLRPRCMWAVCTPTVKRLSQTLWMGNGAGRIWHSSYYTLPEKWHGVQVVTVLDMIYERFTNWFSQPGDELVREQKRRCVQTAESIICISETTRQDVERFYGIDARKIHVVPLAAGEIFRILDQEEHSLKLPIAKPFLLYVGRRWGYKNFNELVKAYSIWPSNKQVDLLAVGGGPWTTEERQNLEELEITDQVHLLGNIDDQALCCLYNQAVAFVYPSLYEGFGIPLIEATACGCPVIASAIPSTSEVAADCPIYFEPGNTGSLLYALDSSLAETRGSPRYRMGLEQAKTYSWDRTARQTLDIYRQLYN